MLIKTFPCWVGMIASYSHRATRPMPRPRFHFTYLDKVRKICTLILYQRSYYQVQSLVMPATYLSLHYSSPVGHRGHISLLFSCEGVGLREAVLPHAFLYAWHIECNINIIHVHDRVLYTIYRHVGGGGGGHQRECLITTHEIYNSKGGYACLFWEWRYVCTGREIPAPLPLWNNAWLYTAIVLAHHKHLLWEVLVDVGGFNGKATGRVFSLLILRWFLGCLIHSQVIYM